MAKKKPATKAADVEAAATTPAPEVPAAGDKKPQVYLNRISEKMIHTVHSEKTGKDYARVGVNLMQDGQRVTGNILVPTAFVQDSTRFQGNERVPNPGFKDVRLGAADYKINVTLGKNDDGTFKQVEMTAAEIKESAAEATKAYRAEKKMEAGKDRPVPEAPAAEAEAQNDGLEA